jgi:hypothetical protein
MKTINFAARFDYISAIEAHWPQVLISLRERVFPVYLRCVGNPWRTDGYTEAGEFYRSSGARSLAGTRGSCTCTRDVGERVRISGHLAPGPCSADDG